MKLLYMQINRDIVRILIFLDETLKELKRRT